MSEAVNILEELDAYVSSLQNKYIQNYRSGSKELIKIQGWIAKKLKQITAQEFLDK